MACYHLGNQNWRGAVILLGEGNRKLQDYQPSYYNLNVTSLRSQSLYLLKQLQQIEPESIGELLVYLNNTDQDSWPKITLLES
ncbi:hypothetical protein GLO73106DRAFT_00036670 [Gloeocapsa sp. PCC 73106]|nr:hypothetical protein GLO73106DRAFT_00036670 [Gloeocapsa sp. PCC 73106]